MFNDGNKTVLIIIGIIIFGLLVDAGYIQSVSGLFAVGLMIFSLFILI